ncbi:MAG: HAD family hydrolase [Proteobacteria bacterium]|nr:HAD family hydrolase [Pseudomonadota bacterium]
MAAFDLIIFDCDGVLIDSEVLACGAVQRQLVGHGIEIDLASVMQRFLGRSLAEVARHYEARLGRAMPESFVTDLKTDIRNAFASDLAAMPHIETLLKTLDIPHCLASSSDIGRIEFSLNLVGLYPYFENRIFTAGMVVHAKPAPDLFLLAAKTMQREPRACLVIEDSASGVTAGKAAGMSVWGFVGGSHYRDRDGAAHLRAAGADRVFQHMSEIERALRTVAGVGHGQ